ncbi:MAG: glycosyltransferase, partial [Clostridiaceae bacterium]|nr:glycosyltransferase [Clostridiaceae bacterium]
AAFTGVKNLTIVTPSQWLAGLVGDSFLGDYPVKVINNGIDLSVFKPTPSDFRQRYSLENKFIILGVANVWTERKGLQYFLELSSYLSSDEVIVLVGLTEKQKATLPSGIIGITRTDSVTELAEIYTAADVFVNLTLEDNFPTTNLEALACGTPVITFNTGGSPECIDDSTGYLVDKGNVDDVATKARLIKTTGKTVYSVACIERAKEFYGSEQRFFEYINMYSSFCNV